MSLVDVAQHPCPVPKTTSSSTKSVEELLFHTPATTHATHVIHKLLQNLHNAPYK